MFVSGFLPTFADFADGTIAMENYYNYNLKLRKYTGEKLLKYSLLKIKKKPIPPITVFQNKPYLNLSPNACVHLRNHGKL